MKKTNEKQRIRQAFKTVKYDISSLRNGVNDWVVFLDGNQRDVRRRLDELEARIASIEQIIMSNV